MPAAQPIIDLDRVTKVYGGDVLALNEVTLSVEEGETCCLLGPNGAGKTTIMRLLQGAIRPTSGHLRLFGVPTTSAGLPEIKTRIGVVPQNPGMYPDLTVHEYLEFVAALYGRGDVGEVLDRFSLTAFASRGTSSLSGGYQRRLLTAAAVLGEPSLLLLDEPTVGLDPLAAADTRSLLREAMRGRTVLMSTHNLAEAEELCESVIIVRQGTVLVHERIDVLRRQAAPRVHVIARQGPDALTSALDVMRVRWSANGNGAWVHLPAPEREMPDVLRGLLDRGLDVFESRVVTPSLEDLFVDVVTSE